MIHDGSAKNYRHGCPIEVDKKMVSGVQLRVACGRPVTRATGCDVHGWTLPVHALRIARQRGASCGTLKERHHKKAPMRSFGCLASAFGCRTFGPFHELSYAESCSHVYAAQHDCKRHNPMYTNAVYDDGCHQDEFWDNRPSEEFPGWKPVHFVDPMHVRGHVREKCHTTLSPYANKDLTKTIVVPAPLSATGARALAKHVNKVGRLKRDVSVHGMDIPMGARLCNVVEARRDADALLRKAVIEEPLPMVVTFRGQKSDEDIVSIVSTEPQRATMRSSLDPKMAVKPGSNLSLDDTTGDIMEIPSRADIVGVGFLRKDEYSMLLKKLSSAQAPIFPVCFEHGINSQAVEQNWRQINRHKATLRHAGRNMYLFLLHRIGHLLNIRRWSGAAN